MRQKDFPGLPHFRTIVATSDDYPCLQSNTVKRQETMKQQNKENIRDLVMRERDLAVSEREWKHRLRGYGYAIRDTNEGRVVTSLVRGRDLLTLGAVA